MLAILLGALVFTSSPCGKDYPEAHHPYCHNTKYESPLRKSDGNTIYETDSIAKRFGITK